MVWFDGMDFTGPIDIGALPHSAGIYLITNLSDAGINIEETVSCHTDTIFIVSESDMINAYSVLNKCIQSAEQIVKD